MPASTSAIAIQCQPLSNRRRRGSSLYCVCSISQGRDADENPEKRRQTRKKVWERLLGDRYSPKNDDTPESPKGENTTLEPTFPSVSSVQLDMSWRPASPKASMQSFFIIKNREHADVAPLSVPVEIFSILNNMHMGTGQMC